MSWPEKQTCIHTFTDKWVAVPSMCVHVSGWQVNEVLLPSQVLKFGATRKSFGWPLSFLIQPVEREGITLIVSM